MKFWRPLFFLLLFASAAAAQVPGDTSAGIRGRIVDVYDDPKFRNHSILLENSAEFPPIDNWLTGDLNGDGRSDIVLVSSTSRIVSFLTDGEAVLRRIDDGTLFPGERALAAGDVDADGADDLILWSDPELKLRIGYSKGDGHFRFAEQLHLPSLAHVKSAFVQPPRAGANAEVVLNSLPDFGVHALRNGIPEPLEYLVPNDAGQPMSDFYNPVFTDINGDGRVDVLTLLNGWWFATGIAPESRIFVVTPSELISAGMIPVQMNGDHRTDFLFHSLGPLPFWFAVYSRGDNGLEVPIASPFPRPIGLNAVRSGDFNGDGYSDLVSALRRRETAELEIIFAMRIPPRGIGGVRMRLEASGRVTETDADGNFFIPGDSFAGEILRPEKAEFAFEPAFRVLSSSAASKRNVAFAGADVSEKGKYIGREHPLVGDPDGPRICLGYKPLGPSREGGITPYSHLERIKWLGTYSFCPEGYAVFGVARIKRGYDGKLLRSAQGRCCALPSKDILTKESTFEKSQCPEGAILTGFIDREKHLSDGPEIRCTKINSSRYRLGEPEPGVFWGAAFGMRSERNRSTLLKIPVAFREGATRESFRGRNLSGCFGGANASIMTSIAGRSCREHSVRQLLYTGERAGDPPAGTPVQIFPDCERIGNAYDPRSGCYRKEKRVF